MTLTLSPRVAYVALLMALPALAQPSVAGLYDVTHPEWADTMQLKDDGTCATGNGHSGRWGFDGRSLTLQWSDGAVDVLMPSGAGQFSSQRGFVLTKRATPPAADRSAVVGSFDAVHPRWQDVVTISADGSFTRSTGEGGLWTFNGSKLVLGWTNFDPEALVLQSNGNFVGAAGRFVLSRQVDAAPVLPPPPLPPPPTSTIAPPPSPRPFAAVKVAGQQCAAEGHVTLEEANAHRKELCALLDKWDIARLAGGAAMDGPGYQCKTRPSDTRKLGHSLCHR